MSAIAFISFNGATLKGDKAAHVKALSALMKAQPTIINLSPPAAAMEALRTAAEASPPLVVEALHAAVEASPAPLVELPPDAAAEPQHTAVEPRATALPAVDAPPDGAVEMAAQHRPKRATAWQGPPPGKAH